MGKPLPRALAIVTILKCSLGTGILGLPYVSGLVRLGIAAPLILVFGATVVLGIWRLIECRTMLLKQVSLEKGGKAELEAADKMGLGPLAIVASRTFGKMGVFAVGVLICTCQLGIGVAYTCVLVQTLAEDAILGRHLPTWSLHLGVCVVLCLLSLMRQLKSLAWLSGAALTIYFYMLVALIYFGSLELADGRAMELSSEQWGPPRWDHFGLFFGNVMFALCAIVLALYVYEDMQLEDPKKFIPVLACSIGSSSMLYVFVGIFGYLSYGDSIKSVFYLSFPAGHPAVTVGEIALIIVITLTYALQMYPVMTVLESATSHFAARSKGHDAAETSQEEQEKSGFSTAHVGVRLMAVLLTQVVAYAVPSFACVTGYSGCFAVAMLSFILPPLCHAKIHQYSLPLKHWIINIYLLVTGLAALFFGMTATSCH